MSDSSRNQRTAAHRITIGRYNENSYEPRCSCGWIGLTVPTYREADNMAGDHIVAVSSTED